MLNKYLLNAFSALHNGNLISQKSNALKDKLKYNVEKKA